MRSVTAGMIVMALLFATSGCGHLTGDQSAGALPPPAAELDEDLVAANLEFALNLLRQLTELHPDENLFFSPTSISLALTMTYMGADGETLDAMAEALGLAGMSSDRVNRACADLLTILRNPDPEVEMLIANSIWARQGLPFREVFLDANREYFDAEVRELNFDDPTASEIINDWVKEATRDRIDGIVADDIDPETIMFLINAMYFRGDWAVQFDPDETADDDFQLPGGTTRELPFMHQSGDFRFLQGDDFRAVALPYGEKRISMYVFLPDQGLTADEFAGEITPDDWRQWMDSFAVSDGTVALPRFVIEYEATLDEALKALGMEVAFDENRADFSRMYPTTGSENVYISEVKHRAFLEVNEQGSEAAAATSVEVGITSYREPFELKMSRPFVFAICDDVTGSILFLGIMRGSED